MRNLIFILIAIVAIQSCNQAKDHYSIQVDLDDTEGKWVRLMSLDDRKYVVSDSVFAEAGTPAVMTNSVVGVKTMYLTVEDGQGSIQLLIENTQYDITGNLESPVIKTDGKAQSDMNAYNDELKYIMEIYYSSISEPAGVDPAAVPIPNWLRSTRSITTRDLRSLEYHWTATLHAG